MLKNSDVYARFLVFLELKDAVAMGKSCAIVRSRKHVEAFRAYLKVIIVAGLQSKRGAFWCETLRIRNDGGYYYLLKIGKSSLFVPEIEQESELIPMSVPCRKRLCRVVNSLSIHLKYRTFVSEAVHITAALLPILSEEDSFWAVAALFTNFELLKSDVLQSVFTAIDECVQLHIPVVGKKLTQVGVVASSYASRWVAFLFTRDLPFPVVIRLLDLFLLDRWTAIIRMSVAVLSLNSEAILASEAEHTATVCESSTKCVAVTESTLLQSLQFHVPRGTE